MVSILVSPGSRAHVLLCPSITCADSQQYSEAAIFCRAAFPSEIILHAEALLFSKLWILSIVSRKRSREIAILYAIESRAVVHYRKYEIKSAIMEESRDSFVGSRRVLIEHSIL